VATLCRSRCSVASGTPEVSRRRAKRCPSVATSRRRRWSRSAEKSHGPIGCAALRFPLGDQGVPEPGGSGAERQGAAVARLGGGQLPSRVGAGDVQNPLVQVVDAQDGQFAPAGAAVRGQPNKEQVQLAPVPMPSPEAVAGVGGHGLQQCRDAGWLDLPSPRAQDRPKRTEPLVRRCLPAAGGLRACRDSNPKPSDP
jgi:hypothetical protein